MSFLKFWKGKKSDEDGSMSGQDSSPGTSPTFETGNYRRSSTGTSSDTSLPISPPIEDEGRKSTRKLSISRSGRYRAKEKKRSIISDKPEVFQYPTDSPGSPVFDPPADWHSSENNRTERLSSIENSVPSIPQTPTSINNSLNSRNSKTNIRNVSEPISNFRLNHQPNFASQATAV